jgi:hypothetical protein
MKAFTCKEMGGPCDKVYLGETAMEIARQSHAHVMATTDEAHGQMRAQMTKPTEEDQRKWWDWFNGKWNKKKDEA